jgi:hypothetical protein
MPSSAVWTFADPDDYTASIRGANAEVTVTGRGEFAAKLIRVDLHRLWMQRLSEKLPRIAHTSHMKGRAFFSFRTQPGPRLLAGGLEMQPSDIVRHSDADTYHQRSFGFATFAAMSLPVEDVIPAGVAIGGLDLTPPKDALILTPTPHATAKPQRLHAAAGRLAEEAPEIIANLEAARGLEQALIGAMVTCLGGGQEREDTLAQGQHAIVMRRFRRVLEENPEAPLFIPEI